MKRCPDCERTLPPTEFTSDKRKKDGLCVYCRVCMSARNKAYRDKDRDGWRERCKAYREANREKLNAYASAQYYKHKEQKNAKTREYYQRKREELIAYQLKYRTENPERLAEYRRERYPEIRENAIHNAKVRKRMLAHRMFPQEKKALIEFYRNCPEGYHVDHIVPLKNPLVSGLHVLANLQYLPAVENLKKRNKFVTGEMS